ncbi:patatin-like phospholipase family protein [Lyngbya sp. CCY1209]|uniref:patatin-like phospholipase family protein n=1 Tax=Lyngbya sp. CCY1209 TaxID=2886103 RepID=UPI002D1FF5C9|nr:patatin-like phospholipase family protein [Lyngbya sp. CCY1209]MEB3886049.1 patatin-like phospholipase family protein [Lyngbya sp. CCY1209]
MEGKPRLAIACQGGGSQTAFTAGVLKKFLEAGVHKNYQIVGLSGTSGGAICALLTWYGLLKAAKGSTDPVSKALVDFWKDNTATHPWEQLLNDSLMYTRRMVEQGRIPYYEANPYDWQWEWVQNLFRTQSPRQEYLDLKKLLEKHVKFSELENLVESSSPKLLVGAVNVLSGGFKVFDSQREQMSVEMILASAAVPTLFKAVEINGEFYWDGLYAENPPMTKLLQTLPEELWVIQINPKEAKTVPTAPEDIVDRRNELEGNIMLAVELRVLQFINQLVELGALKEEFLERYPLHYIKLRMIRMSEPLAESLDYASKLDRSPAHINNLIAEGEQEATAFLNNPNDQQYGPPPWWESEQVFFK